MPHLKKRIGSFPLVLQVITFIPLNVLISSYIHKPDILDTKHIYKKILNYVLLYIMFGVTNSSFYTLNPNQKKKKRIVLSTMSVIAYYTFP